MPDIKETKQILRTAEIVCFDVDSTVLTCEAIDQFALYLGKSEEVSILTKKAMEGSLLFHDALKKRLDVMKPSKDDMDIFFNNERLKLSKGVEELIRLLHARGTHVYLISGGFRVVCESLGVLLGVPIDRVYANSILFDDDGMYSGDGGKKEAVKQILQKYTETSRPKTWRGKDERIKLIMIGDGATDLQTRPPADAVIGYGGVVIRDTVKREADWFVTNFEEIIEVVEGKGGEYI
eukprot:GHVR01120535.1.p1 GENE.GHVR01120535.1~~GHVR01120535.1.p1  ORF type:complete len:236 (+),score=59.74 GHVR01120535.1:366-1073(+)